MANKRIFYACRRAGISPAKLEGAAPVFHTIRGLQNVGVTTTFKLEQVFEIGQLDIYENIEGIPDIEVTTEKVYDGYCPIYLMATQMDSAGNPPQKSSLVARAPGQCILGIAIYDETLSETDHEGVADGTAGTEVHMSGMYVSSLRIQAGVERNVTEGVTFVGNNKVWVLGGDTGNFVSAFRYGQGTWDTPWSGASGNMNPAAIGGSGGVQRRQDILFGSGTTYYCYLPTNIPGVVNIGSVSDPTGVNAVAADGGYTAHIQSWNIHTDLGREQLHELGRLGVYYRYVNWPVEVVNEIAVISSSGDMISAVEEGIYQLAGQSGCGSRYNLVDNRIRFCLCEGLIVDCGDKNKLRNTGMTGGDTGKGNVEVTYTYSNFNVMDVKHPADVTAALRP